MTPAIRALKQAYRAYPQIAESIKTKTTTVSIEAFKAAAYKGPSFSALSLVTLALSGAACATLFDKTLHCDPAALKFPQEDWIVHYLTTHPELNKTLTFKCLPDLYKSIGAMLGNRTVLTEENLQKTLEAIWKAKGLSLDSTEDTDSFNLLKETLVECEVSYRLYPMKHQHRDETAFYNLF